MVLRAHRVGEHRSRGLTRSAPRSRFPVFEGGDLERGEATEKLTRHAQVLRNMARTSVVRAADEAPQAVAYDERYAHRSAETHVGHVLEVDGRNAAQHREA